MDFNSMIDELSKNIKENGSEKTIYWAMLIDVLMRHDCATFYKDRLFIIVPRDADKILDEMDNFGFLPSYFAEFDYSEVKKLYKKNGKPLDPQYLFCYEIEKGLGNPVLGIELPIFFDLSINDEAQQNAFNKLIKLYEDDDDPLFDELEIDDGSDND